MSNIAAILESSAITKILGHLGLPTRHLRYAIPASLAVQSSHPGLSFAAQSQLTRLEHRRGLSICSQPPNFKPTTPIQSGSVPESSVAFRHGLREAPNFIKMFRLPRPLTHEMTRFQAGNPGSWERGEFSVLCGLSKDSVYSDYPPKRTRSRISLSEFRTGDHRSRRPSCGCALRIVSYAAIGDS
jgi:hypothetical protein